MSLTNQIRAGFFVLAALVTIVATLAIQHDSRTATSIEIRSSITVPTQVGLEQVGSLLAEAELAFAVYNSQDRVTAASGLENLSRLTKAETDLIASLSDDFPSPDLRRRPGNRARLAFNLHLDEIAEYGPTDTAIELRHAVERELAELRKALIYLYTSGSRIGLSPEGLQKISNLLNATESVLQRFFDQPGFEFSSVTSPIQQARKVLDDLPLVTAPPVHSLFAGEDLSQAAKDIDEVQNSVRSIRAALFIYRDAEEAELTGTSQREVTKIATDAFLVAQNQIGLLNEEINEIFAVIEQRTIAEGHRNQQIFIVVATTGVLAAIFVAIAMQYTMSRRFSVLAEAAKRVSEGDLDLMLETQGSDGLGAFTDEFNAMAQKLKAREEALNQNLQQLHQAQKMEAVGQLTGGVAHDFNNLLGVMLGNAENAQLELDANNPARRHIHAAIEAINRAGSLTQHLLSFSRQQVLIPTTTDVVELIEGFEYMLKRALGENIDLAIEFGENAWTATIDAHQFENALLNLTLNARDAMPKSGRLTIATENIVLDDVEAGKYEELSPGDYLRVTVRDTGLGIEPKILDSVIEPFFTTKGVGEGSGLGLSMVFGFAKQSEGHMTISSEIGHGTTVALYLPRGLQALKPDTKEEEAPEPRSRAGRILVLEDDEDLRAIPVHILRTHGFEVIEARNGAEALECLRTEEAFDLLFSDVMLPGSINGVDVAQEALRLQPEIQVLFATGYSQNAIEDHGMSGDEVHVLTKPYARKDLLAEVDSLLSRSTP
ncbi:MAG: response regulator [Rhodospirillaceae bacterium]|jgi:signal transduction histidine kinase/ActR/RegA family two-component response regulator|nr:response regulator [Rhodospirillaceae bacterium]